MSGRAARWRAARLTARQPPPLAPAGAEAAPGRVVPAAPLLGMPDGAVEGAADMPLAALESELAAPLSPFFWQPAPAARPAIRMPAKTARDT
ncbi:hypothetical protein DF153_01860 [Burkholderia cenocepacia]|nr:hypothetical protein CFB49_20660 [Burkholderia sp. AU17457]RQU19708.1 hypothetical protein DF152_06390 [Burkholderia cenocepacia]RQU27896.1 hypothetical protein DF153_01860 [Burkholderia cenocepacia]